MIEKIKEIKKQETQSKSEQVKRLRKEMDEIEESAYQLSATVPSKRYTWIQRTFTKRSEYRQMIEEAKRINQEVRDMNARRAKLAEEVFKLPSESALEAELDHIDNMGNLEELGYSFTEAIEFLEKQGLPVVLTDADKYITKDSYFSKEKNSRGKAREISGLDDLMCVHKTRYAPNGSRIKTDKEARALYKSTITIKDKEYEYSYINDRNTVHFAMNDEVSSHAYGQWDDTQYAVLVPFTELPRDRVRQAVSVDTYTEGGVDLTKECWILCPISEVEKVKQNNPNVNVIGYEGENVSKFSPAVLSALGYKAEEVGMWSWINDADQRNYNDLMIREGFTMTPHTYTKEHEAERALSDINKMVAMFNVIKQNGLVKTPEDFDQVFTDITVNMQYPSFGATVSSALRNKFENLGVLAEQLARNGTPISPAILKALETLGKTDYYSKERLTINGLVGPETALSEKEQKFLSQALDKTNDDNEHYQPDIGFETLSSKLIAFSVLDGIQREAERNMTKNPEKSDKETDENTL